MHAGIYRNVARGRREYSRFGKVDQVDTRALILSEPKGRMNNSGSNPNDEISNADEGNADTRAISDERSSSTSYAAALNLLSSIMTPRIRADETGNNFPIMYEYLKILNLEDSLSQLKVIHIAGTKGKGSTCTFIETILRVYGFRTGLYTSPHLISICERFRLDGLEVAGDKFLKYFWWCWNRLKENSMEDIHFFRFLTLLAFKIFTEEKVDVAILEVGLGGKFDATNVVKSPVVCGISSLGYDHMEILGNTLTQIAQEKAGIMKPGIPVFTVPQPEEAMGVLEDVASKLSVPLHVVSPLNPATLGGSSLGLAGDHQYINAGLAVALCCSWLKRIGHLEGLGLQEIAVGDGYLPNSFIKGLAMANMQGRAQVIHDSYAKQLMEESGNANFSELYFYLDGAHTPESMETCAKWFSSAIKMDTASHVQTGEAHKETQKHFTDFSSKFDHQQYSIRDSEMSSKQVLLFNCSSERDPEVLLSQLINTCALQGVNFKKAIFVPSHSSFTQFGSITSTTHDSPKVGLTWQLSLQKTWENVISGCTEITKYDHKIGQGFSALPTCNYFLSENTEDHLNSVVLPSVPLAIKWLREFVRQNQSLRLQVLVTGSMHLIGDVLRVLKDCPA